MPASGRLTLLVMCLLAPVAGCAEESGEGMGTIVDIVLDVEIEQPGAEHKQVVQFTMHRQGGWAKHAILLPVTLFADVPNSVEHVSVGALLPASVKDEFEFAADAHEAVMSGSLELAPCPGGQACSSTFSSVVRSRFAEPTRFEVKLWSSTVVPEDWETSEHLQVALGLAP